MKLTDETYSRIITAKKYMDKNIHEPINLAQISRIALISPFHFHRLFKKIYRQTPHQYLTRRRIDHAKDLLALNRSVKRVCSEVGFESVPSFSLLFKKESGFTPQYYRNIAWLKKKEMQTRPKKYIPGCFIDSCKLEG